MLQTDLFSALCDADVADESTGDAGVGQPRRELPAARQLARRRVAAGQEPGDRLHGLGAGQLPVDRQEEALQEPAPLSAWGSGHCGVTRHEATQVPARSLLEALSAEWVPAALVPDERIMFLPDLSLYVQQRRVRLTAPHAPRPHPRPPATSAAAASPARPSRAAPRAPAPAVRGEGHGVSD